MKRPLITFLLALSLVFGGVGLSVAQEQSTTEAYVVQKGDTLAKIAKKFYGKANLGQKLWRANQNMVANPKKLTPGDVLYIFPETSLALNKPLSVPPAPPGPSVNLYPKPEPLEMAFPKYFSFVTDLKNHPSSTRIRVKRLMPRNVSAKTDSEAGVSTEVVYDKIDQLYEVRLVGEIMASQERGATIRDDGFSQTASGRTLLSTGDNVIIRFNEDLSKILDSDTHDDADPYFTTFPVYATSTVVQEPDRDNPSYGRNLGNLMLYKGRVTIVARVEGLAPPPPADISKLKTRNKDNQDLEAVSYVARITYSEDAILIGDKVFLFLPKDPGPERRLDSPYVESPDSYRAPGR
ncbi:MAG: LysM peptidoglycan-binding domain-containing protein [Deltaproteobacteria bacterium]|jgi:hypothetical protein|nr:LysM peptidoglycan-binding domain-containing protein [Deltaproteobacteria bacterium]